MKAAATPVPLWRTPVFIIACGCIVSLVSFGPRSVLGLFLTPMTEAHGWSREIFALSLAIQNLLWGLGQPFAGMIADKWGPVRVIVCGALLYAAGLSLMAGADTPIALHLSAGVLIGLGMSAASFSIVLAAIGRVVRPHQQSLAFGIGTAAGSLGQFIFGIGAPLAIGAWQWQGALLAMAMLMGLAVIVAPAFYTRRSDTPAFAADQPISAALAQALRHNSYLLLVSGFFVCGFQVAFITAHFPAYLSDAGFSGVIAGIALALIGLFNIIGALMAGVLGSRYAKRRLLSLLYLLRAIVVTLFLVLPQSSLSVYIFAVVMGLLWLSTVPLTSGLVAVMFGPRYMATLFGIVFFSHQLGSFLGVWLGGRLYDIYGSYDIVWWLGVALGLLATVVHLPIKEEPVPYTAMT